MESIFGQWFWFIFAAVLLVGELLNPGVFLMWLAGAAALTGAIHLFFPLGWAGETLLFALLSLALVGLSWRLVKRGWNPASEQPFLNQRHAALVGKTFGLHEAIVNGHGKIQHEGTIWDVEGPNLPKLAKVKVTGLDGLRLKVEAA